MMKKFKIRDCTVRLDRMKQSKRRRSDAIEEVPTAKRTCVDNTSLFGICVKCRSLFHCIDTHICGKSSSIEASQIKTIMEILQEQMKLCNPVAAAPPPPPFPTSAPPPPPPMPNFIQNNELLSKFNALKPTKNSQIVKKGAVKKTNTTHDDMITQLRERLA